MKKSALLIAGIAAAAALLWGVQRQRPAPPPTPNSPAATASNALADRFPPPATFLHPPEEDGSFAAWLQRLPLKPGCPPVRLYNGRPKANQDAHAAVFDLDLDPKNLQQCADAVIRLRAEYLFALKRFNDIRFRFTSGDVAEFKQWAAGCRPVIEGNRVRWEKSAPEDASYASFRKYLLTVFTYAGTLSLSRDMRPAKEVRAGDAFVHGGSPGHAVMVVDVAFPTLPDGRTIFLLAQSYMPAQEIELLKNPADPALSPWYEWRKGDKLITPEWTFEWDELRRFDLERQ